MEDKNSKVELKKTTMAIPTKRRFGDRKEGRRIRSIDPMTVVAPFIITKFIPRQHQCSGN